MRVREVRRLAETIIVEADYTVPMGVGQQTGNLVAVMLCHYYYQVGGVKLFLGHCNGLAAHLIAVFSSYAAHCFVSFEFTIKLRAA